MSTAVMRQSRSFGSRSISSSSTTATMRGASSSVSREMQLVSSGNTRVSVAAPWSRAPSVHGGAGGFGTRISESSQAFSFGGAAVVNNEKFTMQNLNDRLASYLEKVRSLESANGKLELQIREFYEKRNILSKDFTGYFATITKLKAQIVKQYSENQGVVLKLDNAQLAADDFAMKLEMENNLRAMAEADVSRIRGVRDALTLSTSDLELQIEGLKEEMVFMKNSHQEDMRLMRMERTGAVNVEVDGPKPVDLSVVLQETRDQYEAVVEKNKEELEIWLKSKVDSLQTKMVTSSQEVKTSYTELSELKRSYQSLEITHQSIVTELQCLKQNMEEVNGRYSGQLIQLQLTINTLEVELQQLKISIEQQQAEYNQLLDIKMRLEMEIAEYRRLLDGDLTETKKVVVINEVVEVEERKPHIERRTQIIVEEIVNGEVVSSTVDTKVEDIQ
uniref:Keratin 99 n=1 Tax=Gasterosteus aculeatus aculeatus TaxID=481459 RepID=A0AAQ4Q716_GASAC|nr:keratin, type I cytoskeletal 19-like [Gasterosteus aculeatus aculeatus]